MSTATAAPTTLTAWACRSAERQLATLAPDLHERFRANVPRAADVVRDRLLAAAWREGLAEPPAGATRFGFGRVAAAPAGGASDPAGLAYALVGAAAHQVAAELADATANLALAYARRASS